MQLQFTELFRSSAFCLAGLISVLSLASGKAAPVSTNINHHGPSSHHHKGELLRPDENPLALPAIGDQFLRIISPAVLELTLITSKEPDPAPIKEWNFVSDKGDLKLPAPSDFEVRVNGKVVPVKKVGFKRRVRYAPLETRDLRIGNYLYLELAQPVMEGQPVEVMNPRKNVWAEGRKFQVVADPLRYSPAIHVNQLGYLPGEAKLALVGFYLGSLGELSLEPAKKNQEFRLLEVPSSKSVYTGALKPRPDSGFPVPAYQQVLEADFSAFQAPGEYRLQVAGLGVSFPFWIGDGVAAVWARTYARGLYHQRCGASNALPYTRHTHGPCHVAPAEIPTPDFAKALFFLTQSAADSTNTARQSARPLTNFNASLYPFVKQGKIDVSGGHHDAGDYSKYTINSAGMIHHLVLAADAFPGVGDLDNLCLPESGDGKSDVLQIAKWEADFLAKMQDDDGGFFFLVYPRERRYENNVAPDHGDAQIVWPKTTSATAAAVAALAQCASSPRFKKQFPRDAERYLAQARKGWEFLERAIRTHGRDGAYQKLTHYGHEFLHDDELAWAACELFLATGDVKYHRDLTRHFNPADANTRRWSWLRLVGGYGNAVRSYALAVKSGKVRPNQLDVTFLTKCENELIAGAQDQLRRAGESAYGTSFPVETKRVRTAGWYFSGDAAFDIAAACQLDFPSANDPRAKFRAALLSNLNYEAGANPVNVSYVTGLGWVQPREIVHQFAQNDRHILPPAGISLGNIQGSFMWLDHYKKELGALSYPPDGDWKNPYPFYDRWGDSFNTSTEFVVLQPARNLGVTAWLLAQSSLKKQPCTPLRGNIVISGSKAVLEPAAQLRGARILWEAENREPAFGREYSLGSSERKPAWVEAEAWLPDGRWLVATTNLNSPVTQQTSKR